MRDLALSAARARAPSRLRAAAKSKLWCVLPMSQLRRTASRAAWVGGRALGRALAAGRTARASRRARARARARLPPDAIP